jgi:hypothetical protein
MQDVPPNGTQMFFGYQDTKNSSIGPWDETARHPNFQVPPWAWDDSNLK